MCNGKKLIFIPMASEGKELSTHKISNMKAPGQGLVEISEPVLSNGIICEGEGVSCNATIKGKNIRQISLEVMLQIGSYMVGPIKREILQAPENREIKGVVHPRWGTDNEIDHVFKPASGLLHSGEGFTLACMLPVWYGVEPDAQIWSLEGVYQRGGGEPFHVKLEFDNRGSLVRKTGFSPASVGGVDAPFELLIEDGDTFEPYVTLINEKGQLLTGTVNPIMLGGGNHLHWEKIEACPGDYQVGIAVEDFDGQWSRVFTPLTIKDSE
ncbi:MAG: hypothetical protein CVU42_11225 [Chloroflexi bacterium HGW-Chloroflexi-4]|nr:MAG: hypothetical protein CVU42_11225 [Chloroflexi bacterium HGW-Chloroflexi-4]